MNAFSPGMLARGVVVAACLHAILSVASQTKSESSSPAGPQDAERIFAQIVPDDCHAPSDADLAALKAALASFRQKSDLPNEARAATLLGTLYEQLGDSKSALPFLRIALRLSPRDNEAKAGILLKMADAQSDLGPPGAAERDASEALAIAAKLGSPSLRAYALRSRGEAISSDDPKRARADWDKALKLGKQIKDMRLEAAVLTDVGQSVQDYSDPFDLFNRALSFESQVNDCSDKVATLTNLASLERDRGRIRDAVGHFDEAESLGAQVGDQSAEAMTLHEEAVLYWLMGDYGQALSLFTKALQMKRKVGDISSQAETLGALAGVYRDIKLPQEALRAYSRVLPMFRQTKDLQWQVFALNNMGTIEADLHRNAEARKYYNSSIQLAPGAGDRVTPAYSAWGIGELEQAHALSSYLKSLRMARELNQADLEGEVDSSLMDHFRAGRQLNVAVFFGKRAVDKFQSLHEVMGTVSNPLRSSFLQKKASTYRTLAEILIEQGRLVEAQQVLDLLKIQQYSDYLEEQANQSGQQLARSPREAPLEYQFEDQIKRLVALDEALQAAEDAKPKKPIAILQARTAFNSAQKVFDAFVKQLSTQLESQEGPPATVEKVSGAQLELEKMIQANPQLASLYTLEGKDRYLVIVITRAGRFWRSYPVSAADLDAKCQQFLSLLGNPESDINPIAEELFTDLFGPVRNDLQQAGSKTLIWNLDGSLRFIPINALRDGQTHRFLVEDYNIVNFSPLSHSLESIPQLDGAKAIGMGTSRITLDGLRGLQDVPALLDFVVADPDIEASRDGILPGKILLDGQFTEKAMESHLQSQAVVLVATHFNLHPGNDELSYLLIGGKDQDGSGYRYSMAEFEKSSNLHIEGTELFTLSACQTGAANTRSVCAEETIPSVVKTACQAGKVNQLENGVAMESMSELVMQKGADAVLSTLWEVNESGTETLMDDFYHRWVKSADKPTKSEALRQAELDLLYNKVKAPPNKDLTPGPSDLSHPYYWAPFVLMGNWQ